MAEIKVIQGDITTLKVDAIVNAANSSLLGGGGVDGAIHRAAGQDLYNECLKIPPVEMNGIKCRCPTGEARITGSGNLLCKKIIHTVGPIYEDGKHGEDKLLAACYKNSLLLANENGIESIAFSNISTGVYGYPKEEAAKIAIEIVRNTINQVPNVKEIIFVCFETANYNLYNKLLK
jgi:O-acetyl-ADP-ribose deacetylase (regulator of RNase III)